jgi:hypothetical protein
MRDLGRMVYERIHGRDDWETHVPLDIQRDYIDAAMVAITEFRLEPMNYLCWGSISEEQERALFGCVRERPGDGMW